MRFVGAVMLAAGSIMVGSHVWKNTCRRIAMLRSVLTVLELMCAELSIINCSMDELCIYLQRHCDNELKSLFKDVHTGLKMLGDKSFNDIWIDSVEKNLSILNEPEQDEIKKLGSVLGQFELDNQIKSINLCACRINKIFETDSRALPEKKKLCFTLSSSAALMLIIVLI